jgi:hypothetical protein
LPICAKIEIRKELIVMYLSINKKIVLFSIVLLLGIACSGCRAAVTTATGPEKQLVGLWTTESQQVRVELNSKGEPVGSVPVGQWYFFEATGRYWHAARFMTFAIGGVMIQEGRCETANGEIRFLDRTDSFYPDKGSPQQAKYREAIDNETLLYRVVTENSVDVLYLKAGEQDQEVRYLRSKVD